MKPKDSVTKNYMKQNDRFADLCNYYLFHGEQIIKAEDLSECDVTELVLPYKDKNLHGVEKIRDLLKSAVLKQLGDTLILIIGLEGQSDVHYAMPVRDMLYDAMKYTDQVKALAEKHNKAKDWTSSAEFLSGLKKDDKLNPVITITIYWNSGSWDGARSLHEMLSTSNPDILKYVSDYKLNLIVPDEITDFQKFHTELGTLMEFFSCANSGNKMEQLIQRESRNELPMSLDAVHVINTCLNAGLELPEPKEEIKMCKGIDELVARGEARGERKAYIDMVTKGLLDISVAAEQTKMSIEEFRTLMAESHA